MHHSSHLLTLTLALVAPIAIYGQDSNPVLKLTFEKYPIKDAAIQCDVKFDQAGPRPPEYPDFSANNRSVKISKTGYLAIPDPGTSGPYDFENGHNITLEAWVKLTPAMNASPRFIVGKGRTGSPRFAADNQNWSLRLVTEKGATHLSFLFATPKKPNAVTVGYPNQVSPPQPVGTTSLSATRLASLIRYAVGSMVFPSKASGTLRVQQLSRRSLTMTKFASAALTRVCWIPWPSIGRFFPMNRPEFSSPRHTHARFRADSALIQLPRASIPTCGEF